MTFALKLKQLREERGISQRDLAEALEISKGGVGMWESTDRMPNAKQLIQLAKYFRVTTDELLCLSNPDTERAELLTCSAEEQQLIEDFRKLNVYKQKLIKDNIKAMLPAEAESKKKKRL